MAKPLTLGELIAILQDNDPDRCAILSPASEIRCTINSKKRSGTLRAVSRFRLRDNESTCAAEHSRGHFILIQIVDR